MRKSIAAGFVVVALVTTSPAAAQGHRGAPPGQLKAKTPEASGGGAPQPAGVDAPAIDGGIAAAVEPRSFGMWLDDANLAAPGSVWLTASMMRWSTPGGHGVDAPAIGAAVGLTRRTQMSLAIPYSRVSSDGGTSAGLGDVYAGIKIQIAEPAARHIGVSVSPTLEVLTSTATRRASFVLPVSVEVVAGETRAYGSAGVFTRGAAFATGAIERHISTRVLVTGALLQSWTTADALASEAFGLGRTRTDVAGMVAVFAGPSTAFFGGITRTLSRQEFDSARFVLSGGITFALTPPSAIPIRPPR